jgi:hypothetical protein
LVVNVCSAVITECPLILQLRLLLENGEGPKSTEIRGQLNQLKVPYRLITGVILNLLKNSHLL